MLNLLNYGTKGDGITDDSDIINGENKLKNLSVGLLTNLFDSEYIYQNVDDPWEQTTDIEDKKLIINFLVKSLNVIDKIEHITEIGCGYGNLLKYINKSYPNIKLLGYDNSQTCIIRNRNNNNHNNISFKVKRFNEFDYIDNKKTDIILLADITWYILDDLDNFILNLNKNFKGKYFIHILTTYPNQNQKYGLNFFKTHDDIINYFNMNIICSGLLGDKSYFLAKI